MMSNSFKFSQDLTYVLWLKQKKINMWYGSAFEIVRRKQKEIKKLGAGHKIGAGGRGQPNIFFFA